MCNLKYVFTCQISIMLDENEGKSILSMNQTINIGIRCYIADFTALLMYSSLSTHDQSSVIDDYRKFTNTAINTHVIELTKFENYR